MSEGPDFRTSTTEATEEHGEQFYLSIFQQKILLVVAGVTFATGMIAASGWRICAGALAKSDARVADLQQKLDAATNGPKIHAQAMRFIGVVGRGQRMTVVYDGTVTMTSNSIPDLGKQILDWLVHNPNEVGQRGLAQLKARMY